MKKDNNIKQGDIYWLDYPTPGYHGTMCRPCVVVSRTAANNPGADILVCPMSSSISRADLPCNIYVGDVVKEGKPTWVKTNQVHAATYNEFKPELLCGSISSSDIIRVVWGIMRQIALVDDKLVNDELTQAAEAEGCKGE